METIFNCRFVSIVTNPKTNIAPQNIQELHNEFTLLLTAIADSEKHDYKGCVRQLSLLKSILEIAAEETLCSSCSGKKHRNQTLYQNC